VNLIIKIVANDQTKTVSKISINSINANRKVRGGRGEGKI
jgi:hypothetical protein